MVAIKRDAAASAAFHEIRHQAALKCWQKRKRKAEVAAAGGAQVAQAVAGHAVAAAPPRAATQEGQIRLVGNQPPSSVPLTGAGGPRDWRMRGPAGSRGDWAADKWSDLEKRMRETPQKSAKKLGGGVSESYVVVLDDGTKGNFKPSSGELQGRGPGEPLRDGIVVGQQAERELGAWEVAKLVGMDDMVAPVSVRECDVPGGGWDPLGEPYLPGVKRGSFAKWQDGAVANDLAGNRAEMYDGDDGAQRSALFDYIIGNQDRHGANWVIAADKSIKLIDHGLSFGEERRDNGASMFIKRITRSLRMSRMSPAKFVENYTKNKSQILAKLKEIGLPSAAIRRVGNRIDRASVATKWSDFLLDQE